MKKESLNDDKGRGKKQVTSVFDHKDRHIICAE